MSNLTWFVGFLILAWTLGYSLGRIFLDLRKFIDKAK